ncbi:MAG: phenazine biosynthesis protein [Brevibacterium sp.]|nr:phenazine biosynthesis protein [Brevibacterium sp.]
MSISENDDLRNKNLQTVERYMHTKGEDRYHRHNLFVEEGIGGLWTTESGQAIEIRGKSALERHAHWSLQCFPDWEWYNITVHPETDPNHFWVECDGHGAIRFDGYDEGYYENHFLFSFEMDGGLIVRCREFMNPILQLKALGLPVPRIERKGIPQ